jgi:hypothetical protein
VAPEYFFFFHVPDRSWISNPGPDRQHHTFETWRIEIDVLRNLWARAYNAHFTSEHIPKLWQFIQLEPSQKAARAGDTDISRRCDQRTGQVTADMHGPELDNAKWDAVPSHPNLPEEWRSTRVENYPDGDYDQQRC